MVIILYICLFLSWLHNLITLTSSGISPCSGWQLLTEALYAKYIHAIQQRAVNFLCLDKLLSTHFGKITITNLSSHFIIGLVYRVKTDLMHVQTLRLA